MTDLERQVTTATKVAWRRAERTLQTHFRATGAVPWQMALARVQALTELESLLDAYMADSG